MDTQQLFKEGFLEKLAEEGLTEKSFNQLIKQAKFDIAELAKPVFYGSLLAGIGVPYGLGYFGGQIFAKAKAPNEFDIEELDKRELAETYKELADDVDNIRVTPDRINEIKRRKLLRPTVY